MKKYRVEFKLIFGDGSRSGTNVNYIDAENQREAELYVMGKNEHEAVAGIDIIQVSTS